MLPFFLLSCSSNSNLDSENSDDTTDDEVVEENTNSKPNILLIIADDMGIDVTPGYALGEVKPAMPNLSDLISTGITFNNVWSNPVCTPTRAAMITGKFGFRTDMLEPGDELAVSETSIQRFLTDENTNYANAVIGKWHIGNDLNHPASIGVDHFAGFLSGGAVPSYTDWDYVENGATTSTTDYTTTKFTDVAIDWIDEQTDPWFLWLSYNAPHVPFHLPPNELHSQGDLPTDEASISANPEPYFMAMLEAMDTEMGRLFAAMSDEEKENTIIIFIGDNGTPNQVAKVYGNRRNKGTVFQGGVNVPMVVSGATVNRMNQTEDALINVTDIFATIADIAETGTTEINDSKSFKQTFADSNAGSREFAYTEVGVDENTIDFAIRNLTHKYIRFADNTEALYKLTTDALESQNLMDNNLSAEDAAELEKLKAEQIRITQ